MAAKVLRFGVLGPLEMTVDAKPVPLGTPKQRAVLAMLVINRNQPVAASSLISAAWEGWPPPGAKASMHSYVSEIRRLLGDAGVDPSPILVSTAQGYQLSLPETDCDLGRFVAEKTAGVVAAAAGRFEQASRHLSAALAEWRGPVLDDLRNFHFVDALATALTEDKVMAQAARAEAEIACGRGYAVISELEALTAQHPYREPVWAQLITAYYVAERQSDALEAYRRFKATLAHDLGIDPGPTVRALHERILRQEPLDVQQQARAAAVGQVTELDRRTTMGVGGAAAALRDPAGHRHLLQAVATRIGRLADNEIVLDDAKVSRHHAVIIDTGSRYIINDLRSANDFYVQDERVHTSATLNDGDHVRICTHEFTFEAGPK